MAFFASAEVPFTPAVEPWAHLPDRLPAFWQEGAHTKPARISLVVRAGCSATFQGHLTVPGRLFTSLGCGVADISPDGLTARIELSTQSGLLQTCQHFERFDPASSWTETLHAFTVPPGPFELRISCDPGPQGDPRGDWLAVYEAVIAPPEQIQHQRARAHHDYRVRQELQIFSNTYTHEMYTDAPLDAAMYARNALDLAQVLLDRKIGYAVPEFIELLMRKVAQRRLSGEGPVRILSLASGAARTETHLLKKLKPGFVELTLTDVNADLLAQASKRLGGHVRDTLVLDLNHATLPEHSYDVVLCVSALHHFVELEHMAASIARSLKPGGEFWSIGEYVGRPGARLYDDLYDKANALFQQQPPELRRNAITGEVDAALSNFDCSLSSFEGVRADEIEPVFGQYFNAEWLDKRSVVLWRLIDASYVSNYDVSRPPHREWVSRVVELDYELYSKGAPASSMNAVYLPKSQ
jgi:SAM-dependent methyltransferase